MNAMADPSAFRAALAADRELEREARSVPITGQADGPWMVVITHAGKERSVHDRLVAQGFEVFLPLQPLTERQAKRRGVAAVPFFPRMLFARATLDAYRWQAIFNTIGVCRVMCDPMSPKGVKPEFIARLRARVFEEFLAIGCVDPNKPPPAPKVRDRRQWVKLNDVIDGLVAEGLAGRRDSVLLSLLTEGHAAVTQTIRRR